MSGVRAEAMTAFGWCATCGVDLGAGEHHAESCEEDGFVFADAEYKRLLGHEQDARDDYHLVRKRGGKRTAILKERLDRCEAATSARAEELRDVFKRTRKRKCEACGRDFLVYCAACAAMTDEVSL